MGTESVCLAQPVRNLLRFSMDRDSESVALKCLETVASRGTLHRFT
jgi:hypothetical protein